MTWTVFNSDGLFKMQFSGTEQDLFLNCEDTDQIFEGVFGPEYKVVEGEPKNLGRQTRLATRETVEVERRAAYASEADPLFFKWQAGEATEEEWKAKRQEIRDRYPY